MRLRGRRDSRGCPERTPDQRIADRPSRRPVHVRAVDVAAPVVVERHRHPSARSRSLVREPSRDRPRRQRRLRARGRRREAARRHRRMARRWADSLHRAHRRCRRVAPRCRRARRVAALRIELVECRSGCRSARRGHPSGGRVASDRPGRIGQDPSVDRARPAPAVALATACSFGVPGRLQQARPRGDECESGRPRRLAGAHAQRHRPRNRQRLTSVRRAADDDDHDHRARRTTTHRQTRRVPAQAQLRPGSAVDRGSLGGPPRTP